ncbi:MAG: hypothetical protein OIN90_14740 [Candidatus Methanoperedens sp.]|nr:hypothetical protein [Candidatus Methanoperedens sp.]
MFPTLFQDIFNQSQPAPSRADEGADAGQGGRMGIEGRGVNWRAG